ncbi:hypothetical protein ES702_05226 [subsurface metagenome]
MKRGRPKIGEKKTTVVSVTLPREVTEQIDSLSKVLGMNRSEMIRKAWDVYFESIRSTKNV